MTDNLRTIYVTTRSADLAEEVEPFLVPLLPRGWAVSKTPTGASMILTIDDDVDEQMLEFAGPSLRVIGRVESKSANIAPTSVPVVDLPRVSRSACPSTRSC